MPKHRRAAFGVPDGTGLDAELVTLLTSSDLAIEAGTFISHGPASGTAKATLKRSDGTITRWLLSLGRVGGNWIIVTTQPLRQAP